MKTAKAAKMTVSTVKMDQGRFYIKDPFACFCILIGHKCRHFVACSRLKQQNDRPVKRDSVKQTQRRKNRPLRGSVPLAKGKKFDSGSLTENKRKKVSFCV